MLKNQIKEKLECFYNGEITYWKTEEGFVWYDVECGRDSFEVKVEIDNEDHDWWVWEESNKDGWARKYVISL